MGTLFEVYSPVEQYRGTVCGSPGSSSVGRQALGAPDMSYIGLITYRYYGGKVQRNSAEFRVGHNFPGPGKGGVPVLCLEYDG